MFYLYDDIFLKHDTGYSHPENYKRLIGINSVLKFSSIYKKLILPKISPIEIENLELVHSKKYINKVKYECLNNFSYLSTGDTPICKASYEVALYAAGAAVIAVDSIFQNETNTAFCAVRPPGHHASEDIGRGFCIFNNIAIAAKYAQKKHNIKRVLIIDWDIHHGNGTQDIFYSDNSVFYMSTHLYPFYPGTGSYKEIGIRKGINYTLNIPLGYGTGNKKIINIYKNIFFNKAIEFKPELILISAGFDSRTDDPLGSFNIDDSGFKEMTKIILEIASTCCSGKIISFLEGGYNIDGCAKAILTHIETIVNF